MAPADDPGSSDDPREAHEVYDRTAGNYTEWNHRADAHAAYEWPVVRDILPAFDGLRVLDAGTGSGHSAPWLADRGAEVVGLDASHGMLVGAREATASSESHLRPHFVRGGLRAPLPVPDGSFDLVVSQLALGHVADWDRAFAEFARGCRPGGTFVASVDYPFTTYYVIDEEPEDVGDATADSADYYALERFEKLWPAGDGDTRMPVYWRPLSEVTRPPFDTGFALTDLREPEPESNAEHLW
jgi:ubiquinone/menaquinone biosynthesis C-methylase UbiE